MLNPWSHYGSAAEARLWRAVLIPAGEKGPRIKGWPSRGPVTAAEVATWSALSTASMGLILGTHPSLPEHEHVVAIDMDVMNRAARQAVLAIVRRYAPGAPLRSGNRAKAGAAFVRVRAEPGDAVALPQGGKFRFADTPDGKAEMVEVLGAGRQAAIHGTHPSGVPYEWEEGHSIVEMQPTDLPCLTVGQLAEMIAEIDAAMATAGGALVERGRLTAAWGGGEEGVADLTPLPEPFARELLTGLEQAANDLDRNAWVAFVKAVWRVCAPALGEADVFDALLRFTDRWGAAPEGADAEHLRHVIHEGPPPHSYGLRNAVRALRERGWPDRGFLARVDFAGAPPVNDNDTPGATGRAPRPPKVVPADMPEHADALSAMNERFAVARIGNGIAVACFGEPNAVPTLMQKTAFFDLMAPHKLTGSDGRRVQIAQAWFLWGGRLTYPRGVAMYPRGLGGEGASVPAGAFNTWMGFVTTPAPVDGSDWPTIRGYLLGVVAAGDERLFAWLTNWLAHAVQRPHEKPGTALILKGPQGSGKTTFTDLLRAIFHPAHTVSADRPEALLGKHNAHLREGLFVVADEAVFAGDPAANNRLKAFVTDPMMTVEPKGIDAVSVPSFHRLIMTSNEDHVVRAETDARRWAVFDVSGSRVGDAAYFDALHAVLTPEHPEVRALLRDLAAWEIDTGSVRRAPTTGALIGQIVQSLPAPQQWLYELLRDCLPASKALTPQGAAETVPLRADFASGDGEWPAFATRDALMQGFDAWAAGRRYLRGASTNALGNLLKLFGSPMQVRGSEGGRRRVIRLGTLAEARATFAAAHLRGVNDDTVWGSASEDVASLQPVVPTDTGGNATGTVAAFG